MGVSKNRDTPKSSILIGFSIINHPFWGAPIFGNTHIERVLLLFQFRLFLCRPKYGNIQLYDSMTGPMDLPLDTHGIKTYPNKMMPSS